MMNKRFIGILMFVLVLGSISAVIADNGTFTTNGTVVLNESGTNITYDTICVDKERSIYSNSKVNTRDNITLREGALEYFIDNYHNTSETELQEGVWNITENISIPYITYPDYYTAQKVINGDKVVSIEDINGTNYTVTRWTSETYDFLFRMVGDGWNVGIQDLLIYQVFYNLFEMETFDLIPVEPVINETNTTNETNITENTTNQTIITNNKNDEGINTTNPIFNITGEILDFELEPNTATSVATMKETGTTQILLTIGIMLLFISLIVIWNRWRA